VIVNFVLPHGRYRERNCNFVICFTAILLAAGSRTLADTLVLVAGGGTQTEGNAKACKLDKPFALGKDQSGAITICEYSGDVLKIAPSGQLRRIAGGEKGDSGDGGPAAAAKLNAPHHLLVLPNGDALIADTFNSRIRKISAKTGVISAFAGTGKPGFSGDGGPALDAQFGNVYCLALDRRGENLYIDDLDNRRIRKVNLKTGLVLTVAGNGKKGVPEDGSLATESPLLDPRAVAIDSRGNLYILERSGHSLRVVDTAGRIRTVVNASGKAGPAAEGEARTATLRGPKHLCMDREDNVLIADTDNHVIRKYLPKEGKIIRVAGTGEEGSSGVGGPPEKAQLNQPHGVFVDTQGTIYIADSWNDRILKIEAGK
jgi:hypothetical protein